MPKRFHFRVPAGKTAAVKITDDGVYVRFGEAKADKTVIRSHWPHVAVDLAADGSVVGIEFVPVPDQFSLGTIAAKAGVKLPALRAENLEISHKRTGQSLAVAI